MELFNKEDVYDNQISPLMQQIIDICNAHQIPMLASFTYENCESKGTGRCVTLLNKFEDRIDSRLTDAASTVKNGVPTMSSIISIHGSE